MSRTSTPRIRSRGEHRRIASRDRRSALGGRRPVALRYVALVSTVALGWTVARTPGLLAGATSVAVAWTWLGRAGPVDRPPGEDEAAALALRLLAAILQAGLPISTALLATADSMLDPFENEPPGDSRGRDRTRESRRARRRRGGRDRWSPGALAAAGGALRAVGQLLQAGVPPEQAWTALDDAPCYTGVAVAARRCAHSGARLAGALQAAADGLAAERERRLIQRAERVSTWAVLPLGLCFLPAFVCLGIVPVVIGVASGTRW